MFVRPTLSAKFALATIGMTFACGACSNRVDIDYQSKSRQEGTPFPSDLVEVIIHIDKADPPKDIGIILGGEATGHICKGRIPKHPNATSVRLQNCLEFEFRMLLQVHSTMTLLYTRKGDFYDIREVIDYWKANQLHDADKRDPMDLRDSD